MDGLLWFLLIGCAAGWLCGVMLRGKGFGFTGNLLVGVVGSFMGGLLYWLVGAEASNLWGSLVSATLGSVLFLLALGVLRRPRP